MTKVRWIGLGVAIGLVLSLTVGFALATDRPATGAAADGQGATTLQMTASWEDMQAMHDSPAMQRLHAQMPEALRAQCQAMHDQMAQMMSSGGMMSGDMSAHHSGTTGGLAGSAAASGSMMGSSSSGMMGS